MSPEDGVPGGRGPYAESESGETSPPPGHDHPHPDHASGGEVSLLRLVNILLRHRRLMVVAPGVVAALVVGVTLLLPRTYTSTASFMPESGPSRASQLAGLASQFGINVPTSESSESPEFYADLLRSRELLEETVLTEYSVSRGEGGQTATGDLVALLDVEEDERPVAAARAVERLREEHVTVSTDRETGVVELSVSTRWPDLSRQVADRMLELVNGFNLERRQSQASAERAFIEDQLAQAESALHAVEDSLETFLSRNRRYENSPELRFQYERLQRRVDLRQQVFTSLSESYQQARISEVRNTPVITVVEPPALPARPDRRRLVFRGLLGILLGAMLGVFWAFGREILAVTRETEPDDYAEFARLKEEAWKELRETWRGLRRKTG